MKVDFRGPNTDQAAHMLGCKPMKSKDNSLNCSAKAMHERFSRCPKFRRSAFWLCTSTKAFTMWGQAEGVVSRPSQRSVAPGGSLRFEWELYTLLSGFDDCVGGGVLGGLLFVSGVGVWL